MFVIYDCCVYDIEVMHEKEFNEEEWQDICEEALVLSYEKELEEEHNEEEMYISPTPAEGHELILNYLFSLGFTKTEKAKYIYSINPFYSDNEEIRNEKLTQWIETINNQLVSGKKIKKPQYLKEREK